MGGHIAGHGRLIGLLLALLVAIGLCQLAANLFWFAEVGYIEVFWLRLLTQVGIWTIASSVSAVFLFGNLALAKRLRYSRTLEATPGLKARVGSPRSRRRVVESNHSVSWRSTIPEGTPISLKWLLPAVLGLILLMSLLLVQQVQAGATAWQSATNQLNGLLALPDRDRLDVLWQRGRELLSLGATSPLVYLFVGVGIAAAIAVLLYPSMLLSAIALVESLGLGFILSAHWGRFLQCFHALPFGQTEPLFAKDIGSYVFALPIAELLTFWFLDLFLYGLLAVALVYLLAGNSLSQGFFIGFSRSQRQHLAGLGGCFMLALCLHHWISRYELLYSTRGVAYGAGYTDTTVLLPAYTGLSLLAGAIAIVLFWQAFGQRAEGRMNAKLSSAPSTRSAELTSKPHPTPYRPYPTPLLLVVCYLAIAIITTTVLPAVFQRLIVQPNELALEQPYLRRSIALTQAAFALDKIVVKTFDPQATLTFDTLLANQETTRNIRLWDTRPLLETNRQLQQIRPYYRFFDADIDRYTFEESGSRESGVGSREGTRGTLGAATAQQVLIAARELDYAAVPKEAQTWTNEHLVYTHGYGFTLSPVNQVASDGLPDYYVKDIEATTPTSDRTTGDRTLTRLDAAVRASIPTENPRLYYGELANTYVMTGTRVQELDYPNGSGNVYNVYDGSGGIAVNALWRRWLLAGYLKDWRMLFTNDFTPQTKLLFRRNINQRLRAIAPFLQYDRDPYLVVADVGQEGSMGNRESEVGSREPERNTQPSTRSSHAAQSATQNYLYWLVDAYTTSDRYPYAQPGQLNSVSDSETTPRGKKFNYIRNSVKVVIDAYNGTVDFYVADPADPIIQTWGAVFPKLLKPLSQMPSALRSHIRYPADLFNAQAARLMTYHMSDPQVFYNREDVWQVPTEIYGNQPQLVEPYHLITKLTTGKDEEFVLLLPFTPNQRTNLTAWLAARSDGENYGKSLLYVFPKQKLVYGTEQIEALINQDPVISQQISLWNRQGSRALQGNLLVIPIEQSLLYVEPLYLEAEQNSLPTLVRVIVAYENRIVMAETLEKALKAVFQPKQTTPAAIVRPVQ